MLKDKKNAIFRPMYIEYYTNDFDSREFRATI